MDNNEYDSLISYSEQLRDEHKIDEAIVECSAAVDWAVRNGELSKEMRARNLLASLYWSKDDFNNVLTHYGEVINIGREHDMKYTNEYIQALLRIVAFLTRIQPPPPQLFSFANELVEVRSRMVDGDENDKELQDYRMIQESLKRTYRRRHHLRKKKEYVYTEIVGIANNDEN